MRLYIGGRPLDARAARGLVRAAARRAGLAAPVSPHWLRHAHASHALDRGAAVHEVQLTLGHASLATTSRYVHLRPDRSSGHALARLENRPAADPAGPDAPTRSDPLRLPPRAGEVTGRGPCTGLAHAPPRAENA